MEKFAVDLDKVLDDFEFNEDRAEQLANVPPKKHPPPPSNQKRPVVVPYRRPQFEPINMAEADFSAAPERSYQSHRPGRTSVPESGQWSEKNSLLVTDDNDDSDDSEESDNDLEQSEHLDIPKNVNESVSFYKNNSFQDEFLEGRKNADGFVDSKWRDNSQSGADNSSANQVGAPGSFSSLNEFVNSSSNAKVNFKDVKTVSNNLSFNKEKNQNKKTDDPRYIDERRNLPDVASTSKRPAFQSTVTNVTNNTFDLVTNLQFKDQNHPNNSKTESDKSPVISSNDTSEEEFENESVESHVVMRPQLPLPSFNNDITTQSSNFNPEIANNNKSIVTEDAKPKESELSQKPKPVELKSLFSFTEMDHLSDSDLLNYLQEIEDEESAKEKGTTSDLEGRIPDPMTRIPDPKPAGSRILVPPVTIPDSSIIVQVPKPSIPDPHIRVQDHEIPEVTIPVPNTRTRAAIVDVDLATQPDEITSDVESEKHAIFERQVEFVSEPFIKAPSREKPTLEDFTAAVVESTSRVVSDSADVGRINEIHCEPESSFDIYNTGESDNKNIAWTTNSSNTLPEIISSANCNVDQSTGQIVSASAGLSKGVEIRGPTTDRVASEQTATNSGGVDQTFTTTSALIGPNPSGTVPGQSITTTSSVMEPIATISAIGGDLSTTSAVIGQDASSSVIGRDTTSSVIGQDASSSVIGRDATSSMIGRDASSSMIGQDATSSLIGQDASSSVIGRKELISVIGRDAASSVIGRDAASALIGRLVPLERMPVPGRAAVVPRKEVVFEMSLPESQRQSETEDSSPEDEESMEEAAAIVGISAETGATIELRADVDRPGYAVDEVRSPMIQSPRDGSTIHVLGEEERPTRPKYLLLSTVATASPTVTDELAANMGPPGSTPSANQNARNQALDNELNANFGTSSQTDELYDNVVNDRSLGNVATTDSGVDMNVSMDETLDNAANDNALNDNCATEQDCIPVAYAETLTPDPATLDVLTPEERCLGKLPPFWIPDQEAATCMSCDLKFTVLKRRHHCRACGKVLCSKCCGLKFRLEYMDNAEGRVCQPCYDVLFKVLLEEQGEFAGDSPPPHGGSGASTPLGRQPNPNNPMEYCSTIPPLQQEAAGANNPPSVLVPVLKREGSARPKGEAAKQVMFSDGIRPGGDLTELDGSAEPRLPFRRPGRVAKRVSTPPGVPNSAPVTPPRTTLPALDAKTLSYIRTEGGVPPVARIVKGDLSLDDSMSNEQLIAAMRDDSEPPIMFAINRNLFVKVKILNLSCCVNRTCWCFSTQGLGSVGQDEVMFVLELTENEAVLPTDVFTYINSLYQDAVRGSSVSEMGCTLLSTPFLGSSQHGAFIYIRPSFQCLNQLIIPSAPYLVVLLVHRSEVPWARVFPIRLVLRLGAESRYYPCSLVSTRNRKPVYREVGHTIMNVLADFRNLTYSLPAVRGLVIHMEDRQTAVLLPRNRYDQVTRAINNSNEHVLALAANLSLVADSHLVCVQSEDDNSYHTQAINIHNKPRRVTGASYVVFNGALKTSSNLTAKSSIVEDGLMVQISPDTMLALRTALRNMKDFKIGCGPAGADPPDETVEVKWVDDDKHFNVGVCSVIDERCLDGVPSIRVHNGTDYMGRTRLVRWTEVFILQSDEGGSRTQDPVDVGRLSESLARATCQALVKLLDLLAQAGYNKLAVRATINPDNVGYEVGSRGEKLPPIYMNSLDNELVPVLHTAAAANEHADAVLELIFHVLLQ